MCVKYESQPTAETEVSAVGYLEMRCYAEQCWTLFSDELELADLFEKE